MNIASIAFSQCDFRLLQAAKATLLAIYVSSEFTRLSSNGILQVALRAFVNEVICNNRCAIISATACELPLFVIVGRKTLYRTVIGVPDSYAWNRL